MKKKIKYYLLLHIVLLIFSATGIASKLASGAEFLSPKFILFYGLVILGLGVYAIFWQQVIKHLPLVTAYANKAVTVIWGMIFGLLFFEEKITIGKAIGAAIVIAGVYFIVTADAMDEEQAMLETMETSGEVKDEELKAKEEPLC